MYVYYIKQILLVMNRFLIHMILIVGENTPNPSTSPSDQKVPATTLPQHNFSAAEPTTTTHLDNSTSQNTTTFSINSTIHQTQKNILDSTNASGKVLQTQPYFSPLCILHYMYTYINTKHVLRVTLKSQ